MGFGTWEWGFRYPIRWEFDQGESRRFWGSLFSNKTRLSSCSRWRCSCKWGLIRLAWGIGISCCFFPLCCRSMCWYPFWFIAVLVVMVCSALFVLDPVPVALCSHCLLFSFAFSKLQHPDQKQLGDMEGAQESEANARQILDLCEDTEPDGWGICLPSCDDSKVGFQVFVWTCDSNGLSPVYNISRNMFATCFCDLG